MGRASINPVAGKRITAYWMRNNRSSNPRAIESNYAADFVRKLDGEGKEENGARIIQFSIFPDRRREDESEVENFRQLLSVANKKCRGQFAILLDRGK